MTNPPAKTLDFLYFDAGGGHRSAATALKSILEQPRPKQQGEAQQCAEPSARPCTIRLVNLQEVLDSLDIFRKLTGIRLEDIYNLILAKGWTLGSAQGLQLIHGVIRYKNHQPMLRLLREHWARTKPDMVVSLIPNFNRVIYQSLSEALPNVPYVTILTDFADFPPHFWIEQLQPEQDRYFICGTEKAVQQAKALGHRSGGPDGRILKTSGMILRPKFYEPVQVDRAAERLKLGLDPARPTGLVLFGGRGSYAMFQMAKRFWDPASMICGHNNVLVGKLQAMRRNAPLRRRVH